MPIRLYNSLSRTVEPFIPRDDKKVNMFVCGPTVYDYIHLGNARTFAVFDFLVRWLRHREYNVTYLQNITDIDDHILRKAADLRVPWKDIADQYTAAYLDDIKALGCNEVTTYARATDYIPQVIAQVKTLITKGNAYRIEGDGWYFDLSTFPDYGKLSGRTAALAEDAVSRIDDSSKKRNTGDFCVWKFSKPGEPSWEDAELGAGRPGWHIEDTAITEAVFGPQYDLHGGGIDLKFPHHEAEIAQQEAASGKVPFVRHWMHVGFLEISSRKMSKSVGNIDRLRDVLTRYPVEAVRFFLLSGHYRAPLDYSPQSMDAAAAAVQRISEVLAKLAHMPESDSTVDLVPQIDAAETAIFEALDDDLNVPVAIATFFALISQVNRMIPGGLSDASRRHLNRFFTQMGACFGFIPAREEAVPPDVRMLLDQRQVAREAKDYKASDQIRDQLAQMGYTVDDTTYGPLVKRR